MDYFYFRRRTTVEFISVFWSITRRARCELLPILDDLIMDFAVAPQADLVGARQFGILDEDLDAIFLSHSIAILFTIAFSAILIVSGRFLSFFKFFNQMLFFELQLSLKNVHVIIFCDF